MQARQERSIPARACALCNVTSYFVYSSCTLSVRASACMISTRSSQCSLGNTTSCVTKSCSQLLNGIKTTMKHHERGTRACMSIPKTCPPRLLGPRHLHATCSQAPGLQPRSSTREPACDQLVKQVQQMHLTNTANNCTATATHSFTFLCLHTLVTNVPVARRRMQQ